MTTCIVLTSRQTAIVYTTAVANTLSAMNMGRLMERAEYPLIARSFAEEADDWQNLARQIESQNPEMLSRVRDTL